VEEVGGQVKNASHAQTTASLKLFDPRDPSRTSERASSGTRPFAHLDDRRLIVHPDADLVFVEQYRRLGAVLHHAQMDEGIRTLAVASAVSSEGKTLTATNLALMLSGSFRKRVLLVDGDLRKPSLHRLLQIENVTGLRDILLRPGGHMAAAQVLTPTLSVMTSGIQEPDPVSLLVSEAVGQFLADARIQYDWVIVDTPPVVLFPDAELFVSKVDRCVMVVSATTTSPAVAARVVATLGATRIAGVVLNRAASSEIAEGYGYGSYGYAKSDDSKRRAGWWRSRTRSR
jgi:protein-tyrosine kinase